MVSLELECHSGLDVQTLKTVRFWVRRFVRSIGGLVEDDEGQVERGALLISRHVRSKGVMEGS